jgi:hypothetical protein
MNLPEYLATLDATGRKAFAKKAKANLVYLYQLSSGYQGRKPSPKLCQRLVVASANKLTLGELRPEIWATEAA